MNKKQNNAKPLPVNEANFHLFESFTDKAAEMDRDVEDENFIYILHLAVSELWRKDPNDIALQARDGSRELATA